MVVSEKSREEFLKKIEALRSQVKKLEYSEAERRRMEDVLTKKEAKYRSLIANIPDVVWTTNEKGATTFISANVESVYGYSPEEIYKRGDSLWFGRIHPDDVERVKDSFRAVFDKGQKLDIEYRIKRKDGEWIWIRNRSIGAYEKDGVKYADGVFFDVTEHKRDAEEIEKLANFPTTNPNPVLRIAKDGTILYGNEASQPILDLWQCKQGSCLSGRWHELVLKTLGVGRPQEVEAECEDNIYSLTFAPVKNADFVNVYGLNITDRKKAEQERELTIGLLRLLNASNQMYELMRLVIAFLEDWSGCEAVGIRLQEGEDFPYFITRGFPEEFILAENELCSKSEIGELVRDSKGRPFLECMCGNIISGRFDPSKPFFTEHGSFWTNSTTELLAGTTDADRMARTRNRCNTAGYESVALIPLQVGRETFGLLQFNDKQKGRFTSEKISLFERLADNLAIGLAQRRAEKALAESEENYRTIFNTANDAIFVHDMETGAILDVNQRTCELYKCSKEEILELTIDDLSSGEPPYSQKEAIQWVQRAVKEGPQLFEWLMKDADGQLSWVEVNLKKVTICCKDRVLAIVRDISDRKQAEERVRKANETAREAEVAAKLGSWSWDIRANEVNWSDNLCRIHGIEPDEFDHKYDTVMTFIHLDDLQYVQGTAKRMITEKSPTIFEYRIITRDGIEKVVEGTNRLYFDEAGNITQIVGMVQDITERKRAENDLRQEKDRARKYLDIAGVIFVSLDTNGRVTLINNEGCEILKYEYDDIIGRNWFDSFLPKRLRTQVKSVFRKLLTGEIEPVEYFENPVLTKDGQERVIVWHNTVLRDDGGHVIGTLGSGLDITERKQAEIALKESEALLNEVGRISKIGGWRMDLTTRKARWTKGTYDIVEIEQGEPIPGPDEHVGYYLPEYRPMIEKAMQRLIENNEPLDFIAELKTAKGNIKWCQAIGRGIWKDGKCVEVYGTFQDITERKLAEQALSRSERQYRTTINSMGDAIHVVDSDLRLVLFNDRFKKWTEELNIQIDNPIGRKLVDVFPFLPHKVCDEYKQVFISGKVLTTEEVVKIAGREIFTETRKIPIYEEDRVVRVVTVIRDITESRKAKEALQDSEERFRGIYENALVGLYRTTPDGEILMANPALVQMLGYSSFKELAKRNVENIGFSQKYPRSIFKERIEADGQVIGLESGWIKKDGTILFVRESAKAIRDKEGKTLYYEGTVEDITECKRAEEALRESEEKFRSLAEQSPNMIFINRKGGIVYANKKCEEVTGYTREELYSPGFDFLALIAPESQDLIKEKYDRHLKGEETPAYEYTLIDKNGERIEAINTSKLVQYGGMPAIIGIVTDITERKKAEQALREREETLMSIFRAAPIGIGLVSNRVLLRVNDKICEMLGYSQDELVGKNARILYPSDEDYEYVGREKYRQIHKYGTGTVETRWRCKDGRIIDIILSSTVFDAGDFSKGVTFTALDITGRKQAEQRLLEHRAQLKSLASELSLAEERERRRVAIELHDRIGQSLVISKLKLQTLCQSLSSSKYAEVLKEVYDCLGQVIQDTRTLTFDLSYPILYEFGFKEAVAEWLEEQIWRKHGIKTEFEDDGQPKQLDEDVRVLLFRDVRELLINVVKHAKASKVKVSISRVDDDIQVCVEDNGVGFNADEIALLPSAEGGFGLFSIRERLEQIGGRLDIESAPNRGSRITMTAPIKCESVTDGAQK